MNTQDFTTSIIVNQEPAIVFKSIQNFRGWWSEQIDGATDQLNETFFYHYKEVHICKVKLIEVIPNKKLVYHIIDNQFSFIEDKREWIDTQLIFELFTEDDKTKIVFTHKGLTPQDECYHICFESWGNYINKSLYNLITTGKGNPNPLEEDGFNAQIVEKWKLK